MKCVRQEGLRTQLLKWQINMLLLAIVIKLIYWRHSLVRLIITAVSARELVYMKGLTYAKRRL
jgi:hypothetical protein